ncbi:MAG: hypothetical protein QG564_269 [Campylobacterota bacterium]|nr:hypothetical protein [Campylobacterota bacterium]
MLFYNKKILIVDGKAIKSLINKSLFVIIHYIATYFYTYCLLLGMILLK